MFRRPAVAGRFYPAEPDRLTEMIRGFVSAAGTTPADVSARTAQSTQSGRSPFGIVVPHAGYMYSGHVAGAVYAAIRIPQHVIILCPNHTGYGVPLSIMRAGEWETPLGNMRIDEQLCDALMAADPGLEHDLAAHRFEHALEVQLPFLQVIAGADIRFVPITVGTHAWTDLHALGSAIAQVVSNSEKDILIIASSDMNHYESDSITRVKDAKAIARILALDAAGLHDTVTKERISMCGAGPAAAMLVAAQQLKASKAQLVKYATSAEVSGDFDRVVGYAGMIVG